MTVYKRHRLPRKLFAEIRSVKTDTQMSCNIANSSHSANAIAGRVKRWRKCRDRKATGHDSNNSAADAGLSGKACAVHPLA
jgi:hypothetical protein